MKLLSVEITNFRSVRRKLKIREFNSRLFTFVGANNVGKSNILRAINLFFNREVEPGVPFIPSADIAEGENRAVISVTFQFSRADDKRMTTYIDTKYPAEFKEYIVPITLVCKPNGTLQYSFAVAKGQRKTLEDLMTRVQEYVSCIYIPAIKDYRAVLDAQMMRKIVGATFQGWGRGRYGSQTIGEQKEKFRKLLGEIQKVLDESGNYVSSILSSVVSSIERFKFSLPYDNLEDFLGRLLLVIKEQHLSEDISLGNVGSGVQSFAILSMLKLLHEIRPTNTHKKSKFLWLIEEPETFMHHDLQRKTYEKLKEYSKGGHIFITTHSPVFVDKHDFGSAFVVTHDGKTAQMAHVTSKSIRGVIAGNLGVSFGDFFDFDRNNVLLEGETDRTLLKELNSLFAKRGPRILDLSTVALIACGSANAIPHFYGMYNVFSRYADFLALFDRDDAGIKNRTDLLSQGVQESKLLLIPQSVYKTKNGIEDIVSKDVWDDCVQKLDTDGLITVKTSKGVIRDYEYDRAKRIKVKEKFVEYLIAHAKKDLTPFEKYRELLEQIASALAK